jgi:hypothetical protein
MDSVMLQGLRETRAGRNLLAQLSVSIEVARYELYQLQSSLSQQPVL